MILSLINVIKRNQYIKLLLFDPLYCFWPAAGHHHNVAERRRPEHVHPAHRQRCPTPRHSTGRRLSPRRRSPSSPKRLPRSGEVYRRRSSRRRPGVPLPQERAGGVERVLQRHVLVVPEGEQGRARHAAGGGRRNAEQVVRGTSSGKLCLLTL